MLCCGAAQRVLQRRRRGSDLQRQRRRERALLDFALQRGAEPLEQLQPASQPGPRATKGSRDPVRAFALIEEQAHEPRLLERADRAADRIQRQAVAGCRPVVELLDDHRDQPPAQGARGLIAQQSVDDLQPERGRAHDQRHAQPQLAQAVLQLVDPVRVLQVRGAGWDQAADLDHDRLHRPKPSRARIADTDSQSSPPVVFAGPGDMGSNCHTPSAQPARQGRCATRPSSSRRASARSRL